MIAQELYIDNQRVDLSEDSLILFTYQRSDHTNPTAVKNSYTKTVTLPGTPNNNTIFNGLFKLDRLQTSSIFDPRKRVPFKLFKDGDLVEQGYIKMSKINRNRDYITYDITLYGGLGDFFYGLTYDDDGSKLTLADLNYNLSTTSFMINRFNLFDAWDNLNIIDTADSNALWDTFNFAPCYNGVPDNDNFDASKILTSISATKGARIVVKNDDDNWEQKSGFPYQYPLSASTSEIEYSALDGKWGIITLPEETNEWNVKDLRAYLQRPVIRLRKVFEAIQRYATSLGYSFVLDSDFFNTRNDYYNKSWITLAMLNSVKEDVTSTDYITLGNSTTNIAILASSKTPADYLISFAKIFNLFFVYDHVNNKITLTTKDKFYTSSNIQNLDDRVDFADMTVNPLNFDYKWVNFKYDEGESELLDKYNTAYGFDYGSWRINTGYDFDSDIKELPENVVFKDALDTLEQSAYFIQYVVGTQGAQKFSPVQLNVDGCTYSLFKKSIDSTGQVTYEDESRDIKRATPIFTDYYCLTDYKNGYYYDAIPKPQFHDEDGKPTDGADVLLFFNGMHMPHIINRTGSIVNPVSYWMSDDMDEMATVCDGKYCWLYPNLADEEGTGVQHLRVDTLPSFNRGLFDYSTSTITKSLDFRSPQVLYMPKFKISNEVTISEQVGWVDYLADMYNASTKVVECNVVLDNNDINAALRRFYWFGGSYWIITEISDFNYDTKLTKCTFQKVNDISNITPVLYIDMTGGDFNLYGSSNTIIVTLKGGGTSTTVPTVTPSDDWIHTSVTPESDNSYQVTITADENEGPARGGTVTIDWGGNETTYNVNQSGYYYVTIPSSTDHGTVTTSTNKVAPGGSVTFTFTPDDFYGLARVLVNGDDVTSQIINNQYTLTYAEGDISVVAEFEAIIKVTLTINATPDSSNITIE